MHDNTNDKAIISIFQNIRVGDAFAADSMK